MAKLAIKKASTDVTVYLFIQASNVTTGAGLTGLVYNTTDLVASYVRPLAARAAITLATLAAADSAHSDGGFKEVDATNMPGVYRLDLPDAVCATGVPSVVVMLKGAANMAPVLLEIQLTDFDLNTAAITAAGIADAVWDEATADHTTSTTFGAVKTDTAAILADTGTDGVVLTAAGLNADAVTKIQSGLATPTNITAGTITTVTNLTNLPTMPTGWVTAAGLKADAVTEIQSGLATAAALDAVDNFIDTEVAAILAAVDNEVAAIKAKTDNLPASPAAVGSAMTLTAAYDKAKDDVLTPLGVVDGVVDAIKAKTDLIPATPAVADEYDAALAAIQADLDNPAQYKADVSGLATQASVNAIPTTPLLAANYTAPDNASIAAILEDTGTTIPATLVTIDNEIAVIDGNVDAVLDDTGTSGVLLSTSALTSIFDDEVIVGTYNFSDLLKIMASALAGKLSGGSTTTLTFRGVDDTSDVIVTTVDANKNRTNVVITV